MKPLDEMTEDDILDESVFIELMDMADQIKRTRLEIALKKRAVELGVTQYFKDLLAAYKKTDKEMKQKKQQESQVCTLDNYTNFCGPYDELACGSWVAKLNGIYSQNNSTLDQVACYHPILPVERMKNLETGEEQIKLAYFRNGRWDEITVPKIMITSANKIVALSGRGISVTSENAKLLVKYLSDVENLNDDYIAVQYSSSKLGWHGQEFLPYDTDILFDGDLRFKSIFDSITENGSESTWVNHVKELRRSGRMEVKFLLAASFASILIQPLGGLPFFVDLWGETEGGKTVSLMVAASVWANPDESQYIGDFKSTDVALEAKADMLNNLPVLLDDTSKTSARIRDNFEGVVYDLCSGKGKSRSNKELGINRENRWRNVIICNGERPLSGYVDQGGAINRIIEVECGEKVFDDPGKTAEIVKKNYGFAGRRFVEIVKEIGIGQIRSIQDKFKRELLSMEKMEKQALSLSIVLTADKIATEYIFKDKHNITVKEAEKLLTDREMVSDNVRCYDYIQDKVAMNSIRFDPQANIEQWGVLEDGYAIFYNRAFDELCRNGGFSKTSFLSWASRNNLIMSDSKGNPTKQKKISGKNNRCVWLKLDADIDVDGFRSADGLDLPFP